MSVLRVLSLLVATTILLAACGDDDGGGEQALGEQKVEGALVEEGQPREHVEGPVAYDSAPPSGGDHAPIWLNCGFYDDPVSDENAVHALEHGVVWFAHHPDLDPDGIETLRALWASNAGRVIVSPYPGLDAPVVAVAWERRLEVDDPGDPRLAEFLDEYIDAPSAPEPRAACTGGVGG